MSSEWHDVKVAAVERAAEGLSTIRLDARGTALAGAHAKPGQYVKIAVEGKGESFFAIASAPGGPGETLELLVKAGAPLADDLIASGPGRVLRVSAPQGKGFPLEKARGRRVLLFATGSGISPIRSTIETIRRDRKAFGEVTLYFGVRTPQAFAYEPECREWERDGIRVLRTVSQPGDSGWTGLTGYVQSHLSELQADGAIAFLCGQKAMVQGVTEALLSRGMTRDDVHLNF